MRYLVLHTMLMESSEWAAMFELNLPEYTGVDQVVELSSNA